MDLLRARYQQEEEATKLRVARLRKLLPAMVELLIGEGASRVILFGSLVREDAHHSETDIDLGVEGLPIESTNRVHRQLEEMLGADLVWTDDRIRGVDLVRLEDSSAHLRARIETDGVELSRVTR